MRRKQVIILVRSEWRVALIGTVFALGILLITYRPILPLYRTNILFGINQTPLDSARLDDKERYYGWVTSEFSAIVLSDWGNASAFYSELRWRLWLRGYRFDLDELAQLVHWSVNSSRVKVSVEHVDEGVLKAIAQAAAETFMAFDNSKIPQLELAAAKATQFDQLLLIDSPPPTIREQLELPLRFLLGLGFGPLLALVIARHKHKIGSGSTIEVIGLPLIGTIPRTEKWYNLPR